ncbi:MAG: hypothetical protein J3K34DRAFT_398220 [Monoraphidium minutum]|nr:MAG: hypothetical protein J3K34DRAFT_398220 [Monoraphidium minutum]
MHPIQRRRAAAVGDPERVGVQVASGVEGHVGESSLSPLFSWRAAGRSDPAPPSITSHAPQQHPGLLAGQWMSREGGLEGGRKPHTACAPHTAGERWRVKGGTWRACGCEPVSPPVPCSLQAPPGRPEGGGRRRPPHGARGRPGAKEPRGRDVASRDLVGRGTRAGLGLPWSARGGRRAAGSGGCQITKGAQGRRHRARGGRYSP